MRKIYCDYCKREIQSSEQLFGIEIKRGHIESGRTLEIILDDVCMDCYMQVKHVIDNAESWRMRN